MHNQILKHYFQYSFRLLEPTLYLQMKNKLETNPLFYLLGFSLHEHRPFTKAFFLMMIQIEKEQVKVM